MSKHHLNALVEATFFAALAMVFSLLPDVAGWLSPSLGIFPIVLLALRRGIRYSFLAAFLWGSLHFILGRVYYLSFWQVVLEYILAFLVIGLSGIMQRTFQKALAESHQRRALGESLLALFIAVVGKYLCHYLAGIIFWRDYAGNLSPELYSLAVNGTAGLVTFLVLGAVLVILLYAYPNIFKIS